MSLPIPHALTVADLGDEPGLAARLYAERHGHVRREYVGVPTWRSRAGYRPVTAEEGLAHQAAMLKAAYGPADEQGA